MESHTRLCVLLIFVVAPYCMAHIIGSCPTPTQFRFMKQRTAAQGWLVLRLPHHRGATGDGDSYILEFLGLKNMGFEAFCRRKRVEPTIVSWSAGDKVVYKSFGFVVWVLRVSGFIVSGSLSSPLDSTRAEITGMPGEWTARACAIGAK